ncbi:DUF3006 domain-containing protein [Ructibacterium gallinarum]|uniref:DUF3006 domain-containing protein n=1 Tax=Ructibacterium gallinarum TaxID=2779355 RepID=A0A9D5LYA9_9FIRM|nr:DUF3006 domain-containing protein [Ructibacterium gallinarum]MBE5039112.1 DUF3006 domain-containing protein [Ructibacterium gallinarum]
MTVIIDRIEGDTAVAELPDGSFAALSIKLIPGVREGDAVTISIDQEATLKRKKHIDQLMKQVFDENRK